MARCRNLTLVLMVLGIFATEAAAWHGRGHDLATRVALAALRNDVPAFFVAGTDTIAHCSLDADAFTRPIAPAELHDQEAPEHYFDMELLGGSPVPANRYAFIDFCAAKGLKPNKIGLLPYAVVEWTQRLTVAFAEHRRWPENPAIRAKCLVYAGLLAHYAEDLTQPLHLTIHWDGRARADGNSPRSGIHNKVDALLGKLPVDPGSVAKGWPIKPLGELLPAALAEIAQGRTLIDHVYELEAQLPGMDEPLDASGKAADFARERLDAAGKFLASLYLTAWLDSQKITLPPWYRQGTLAGQLSQDANAPAGKVLYRSQSLQKTNSP